VKPVVISVELLAQIAQHARSTYPEECCGFLISRPGTVGEDAPREILRAMPVTNSFEGDRGRRYLVAPEELRLTERRLEASGEILAGFYHSHPDHPAQPSRFDQDHAWPWYTYVVTRITQDEIGETRAFELDPDSSEFREVPLRSIDHEPSVERTG
jgi:proteasome lid subunit RPN8/RPN11